jgi:single-strand DNA-binding protein
MYSLNRATILGNLTADPEVRQVSSGQTVCTFGVATNRRWTNKNGEKQEDVEYHNIVAWGKLAEICGQYLQKGSKVYMEGRLQTRDWEGQDGVRRYKTEIVANNMIMLDSKGSSGRSSGGGGGGGFTPPSPQKSSGGNQGGGQKKDEPSADPEEEIDVEDIPF